MKKSRKTMNDRFMNWKNNSRCWSIQEIIWKQNNKKKIEEEMMNLHYEKKMVCFYRCMKGWRLNENWKKFTSTMSCFPSNTNTTNTRNKVIINTLLNNQEIDWLKVKKILEILLESSYEPNSLSVDSMKSLSFVSL